jgi:hypothetical protein
VEVIRNGRVLDPAAAFAAPEPVPAAARRREPAENAAPAGAEAGPAGPIVLPPGTQLPPGIQLPPGMVIAPGPAAPPVQGPAAGALR